LKFFFNRKGHKGLRKGR